MWQYPERELCDLLCYNTQVWDYAVSSFLGIFAPYMNKSYQNDVR